MNRTIEDVNYDDNRSFDGGLFSIYCELCEFLKSKRTEDGYQKFLEYVRNA